MIPLNAVAVEVVSSDFDGEAVVEIAPSGSGKTVTLMNEGTIQVKDGEAYRFLALSVLDTDPQVRC